ncbi:nuclear transport factor 2 family protein [Rugamonas sp.]|uniref:YybH family protein n=1 Tax=Rugamonas sp. TaxID=1926287 RepID=UPI0025CB7A4B|nr:nuclear transport factor 2 family protein [Rugamonas sp.]
MKIFSICAAMVLALTAACATAPPPASAQLQQQVGDTERAFAAAMKARDFEAFVSFISDEAIFSGGEQPLRGKDAIANVWKRFFVKPEAPFFWTPDRVEVLASGTLASTAGPVYDASGKLIAHFSSIWRLEAPGKWRIVFDGGNEVCDCQKPQ